MTLTEQFPKENRLLNSNEFNSLRFDSNCKKGKGYKLIYKKTTSERCSRLGLAVSSKVGNAVFRNKIKRIAREVFRKTHFKTNLDLLFIPHKLVDPNYLYKDLEKSLIELRG